VPHPAGLPDIFVDRSLGRRAVPELLRAAGLRLVTLAERYGIPADESVTDERWLTDAAMREEIVFMKDSRVRINIAERSAIVRNGVRCFCIANQQLSAELMAQRFLRNLGRIADACADSGPFVYSVEPGRIVKLPLSR
jgi:hypothetical protein